MKQLGYVLYLRDRALLGYQFSKVDDKGELEILSGKPGSVQRRRAYERFISHYGLGEQIDPDAAREFLAASSAGRVPRWVLGAVDLHDIKQAAKGGEE